jgi:hypothetical protein
MLKLTLQIVVAMWLQSAVNIHIQAPRTANQIYMFHDFFNPSKENSMSQTSYWNGYSVCVFFICMIDI